MWCDQVCQPRLLFSFMPMCCGVHTSVDTTPSRECGSLAPFLANRASWNRDLPAKLVTRAGRDRPPNATQVSLLSGAQIRRMCPFCALNAEGSVG